MTCKTCQHKIRCFLGLKKCPPPSVSTGGSIASSTSAGRRLEPTILQAACDEKARQRWVEKMPPYKAPRQMERSPVTYQRMTEVVSSVDDTPVVALAAIAMLDTGYNPGYNAWEAPAPTPVYEAEARLQAPQSCEPAPVYYEPPAPSPSYESSSYCDNSIWTSND